MKSKDELVIYRDFFKVYFGQKSSSLCLKNFKKSRYSFELKNILINYDIDQVIVLDQIHSNQGICVDDLNLHTGSSILQYQGDYLITSIKNIALVVLTADCIPLVLIDPDKQVVAIVHAGWKGAFFGVLEKVLQIMHEKYQTNYAHLLSIFGPSARGCCYQVSEDFVINFEKKIGKIEFFYQRDGTYYFDNNQFLQQVLKKYGILEQNINIENSFCTICNVHYCSFRREGEQSRRQITMVALI